MAETATYTWLTFDKKAAVNGVLVGFRQDDDNDLSCTGQLYRTTHDTYYDSYEVVIRGSKLWIDDSGNVTKVYPTNSEFSIGSTLMMVVADMKTTYGTQQAITRSVGEDAETTANIQALEPRDQFAMQALNAMLSQMKSPEAYGDAAILSVCNAAYKWAQGMMIAAANARAAVKKSGGDGGGEDEDEEKKEIAVNTAEITETSEKLLYNISVNLSNLHLLEKEHYKEVKENGYKVVGSDAEDAVPVKTEVTEVKKLPDVKVIELPGVKIAEMPNVTLNGTPDVRVTNMPTEPVNVSVSGTADVQVTNMPSVPTEPVSVTGTVSVDNFPSSSSENNS